MRLLLDECLPRKLKFLLPEHDVATVPEAGWAGKKNGELLKLAATKFDVFITADQNLSYQQKLENAPLPVIVLITNNNRLETYTDLIPQLRTILSKTSITGVIRIST